jgi:acid phosphatase type 7
MRISLPVVLALAVFMPATAGAATTFSVPKSELRDPLVFIAYGDIRFTDPGEKEASSPAARQALVAKIAGENPAALFINGDIPWHGIAEDYEVYRKETQAWREKHLRIYPALGNHEFSACSGPGCLARWWNAFHELHGRRWYSVALGDKVVAITLDSISPLLPGSEQRIWFEAQIAALDPKVRAVLIVVHHPPVADIQTVKLVDHNPRQNEQSLAEYLKEASSRSAVHFVVSAGHIHNYERLAQDGVTYLVSGGGGATPYDVDRTAADLYQSRDFPNYHYVRFELRGGKLRAEMIRLEDYSSPTPRDWKVRDRFEISLRP